MEMRNEKVPIQAGNPAGSKFADIAKSYARHTNFELARVFGT
jgi:hypothetical protein